MLYALLLIPIALALEYLLHAPPPLVFLASILAIVPLAEWIRRATEQLAKLSGPAVGGLLNVTFGNVAELILALFVLSAGQAEVVKGQITGSIIGNSLLGLGLAVLLGGLRYPQQRFKRERAGLLSSLLILSVIALLIPAIFDYTERNLASGAPVSQLDEHLSLGVAGVLIIVYIANLIYTLVTHRDVFGGHEEGGEATWSTARALLVLLACTAGTAWMAELVSGALEPTAATLDIPIFFLGVTVLAIVGNAAEYVSALYFARKDQIGLVMSITVGSSIQVALLVAPVLVLVSYFLGQPMNLVFSNPLELIAIAAAAFTVNAIAQDGETTWFEGLLLLAVYLLLALAFFFVTPPT
jgi:Ca2+:H+ antiporter